jgi:hypothetical protein
VPKINFIRFLETGAIAGCNIHAFIYCAHWHYYLIPTDLMMNMSGLGVSMTEISNYVSKSL